MEQKQKDALWAQYTKQTHRLGRVLSLITVALLLGAPCEVTEQQLREAHIKIR